MIYHTNTNQKKAGIALLISDRGYFKAKKVNQSYFKARRHYIG
jgi:hypothetical protein